MSLPVVAGTRDSPEHFEANGEALAKLEQAGGPWVTGL